MNAYSKSWWGWGLAGAILCPAVLLAAGGRLSPCIAAENRPYLDALFVSFAAMFAALGISALPIRPWLRLVLFFLAIPAFTWGVRAFAPWAPV